MTDANVQPDGEIEDPVAQLQDLRQRIYAGEEPGPEEYAKVLDAIRAGRRAGASTAAAKKARTGPATVDTASILSGITRKSNSTVKGG